MKMRNKQGGFTLVEIAIVLVIVGLLLAGVLKGQELIESSKIRAAVSELNSITAANNAYIDRFRASPGDDGPLAAVQARGPTWTPITESGNSNGALASAAGVVFLPTVESLAFWQQLKAAGFITGSPADVGVAALPRNAFGGLIGVFGGAPAVAAANGRSVCISQVPGKAARAIDVQLDNSLPNTGDVRATLSAAGANTNPGAVSLTYVDNLFYTVCRTL